MATAIFSTGPIENAVGVLNTQFATELIVKVLNHNVNDNVSVEVRLFNLDVDLRQFVGSTFITTGPKSADFESITLPANTLQYEVVFIINTNGNPNLVLVSSWGKDGSGDIITAQRMIHEEMHRLS